MSLCEVTTERLRLRQWRDGDRDPFAALNADPAVMEFFPSVLDRNASDVLVDRFSKEIADRGYGLWALDLLDTGEFIGFTGLSTPSFEAPFTPCVEIGWRLAHRAWGHGYATEAATASLDVAFHVLELDEVVAFTASINRRSRAVMERISMTRDERDDFNHPLIADHHRLSAHVLYRVSRDTWTTRRASAHLLSNDSADNAR